MPELSIWLRLWGMRWSMERRWTVCTMQLRTPRAVQTWLFGHSVSQAKPSLAYMIGLGRLKPSTEFQSSAIVIVLPVFSFLRSCCYILVFQLACFQIFFVTSTHHLLRKLIRIVQFQIRNLCKTKKTLRGSCAHK